MFHIGRITIYLISVLYCLDGAKPKTCTYRFTVQAPEDMSATCSHPPGGVPAPPPPAPAAAAGAGAASSTNLDQDTARKVLLTVTKLMHQQNVVQEVSSAHLLIGELTASLAAQQRLYDVLMTRLVNLQSQVNLIGSAAPEPPGERRINFPDFTGITTRSDGCPVKHPRRLYEISPVKSTEHEIIRVVPRSCLEWLRRGSNLTGHFLIDPDGLEGEAPFSVVCDMTSDPPEAIVHHDSESRTHVQGFEAHGSFTRRVHYGVSTVQLAALTAHASSCRQFLSWECKGASVSDDTWWTSRDERQMRYWGGGSPRHYCACAVNRTCVGDSVCNCDANDDTRWLEDSGFLRDAASLPVSQIHAGDTGNQEEEGYFTLGPLICVSDAGSPYAEINAFRPLVTWPPFHVFCDYDGWLVFSRRVTSNGSDVTETAASGATAVKEDFGKSWVEYRTGFGDLGGEFWLGLDKVHQITSQAGLEYSLRVDLETGVGVKFHALYSGFTVGSEETGFMLRVGGYTGGTAGDNLSVPGGVKFSTHDADNEAWGEGQCADAAGGGWWWYDSCGRSGLTGRVLKWGDIEGIHSAELKLKVMAY